jgi:NADH-quinone oxidoreductase subunit N
VVTSVIGAYYYLRIVKVMYFDEPVQPFERMAPGVSFVLVVSSAVVVLFWIVPAPVVSAAGAAARSLF